MIPFCLATFLAAMLMHTSNKMYHLCARTLLLADKKVCWAMFG